MEPTETVKLPVIHSALMLAAAGWLFTGCQSKSIYYWGHYEDVIYVMYNNPDKASPELLASQLEEDEHKAASLNKPLPPGFHAQLGYLYAQMGKTDQAREQYEKEKQQFPESAVFMNRMLGNQPTK
jgi:hypothetical protein